MIVKHVFISGKVASQYIMINVTIFGGILGKNLDMYLRNTAAVQTHAYRKRILAVLVVTPVHAWVRDMRARFE